MEKLTMQEASAMWYDFNGYAWAAWFEADRQEGAGEITREECGNRIRRIRESRHIAYSLLFGIHATL